MYVHSPGHQDTPTFCREVLSSPQFVEFVSANMMLFLAVSVRTEEGVSCKKKKGGGGGGGGGMEPLVDGWGGGGGGG